MALEIVIGTSPSGEFSLDHEVDPLRPALLYGDHVRLFSPAAP
jgi:hypothetical protein